MDWLVMIAWEMCDREWAFASSRGELQRTVYESLRSASIAIERMRQHLQYHDKIVGKI